MAARGRALPGGRPGPLPHSETRTPKGPTPRLQRPGNGSANPTHHQNRTFPPPFIQRSQNPRSMGKAWLFGRTFRIRSFLSASWFVGERTDSARTARFPSESPAVEGRGSSPCTSWVCRVSSRFPMPAAAAPRAKRPRRPRLRRSPSPSDPPRPWTAAYRHGPLRGPRARRRTEVLSFKPGPGKAVAGRRPEGGRPARPSMHEIECLRVSLFRPFRNSVLQNL